MIFLDCKSHYSIKQVYGSPTSLVESCKTLGCTHVALTDYDSISGSVEFVKACKDNELKPILGCTFNTQEGRITVLAKNLDGWKALIKLVSLSYTKEFYDEIHEKPYLTIDKLCEYSINLIGILGFPGDLISNKLFSKPVYHLKREELKKEVVLDPASTIKEIYGKLKPYFGNLYLGLGINKSDYISWMNEVVRDTGLPTVILTNSHYPNSDDYTYLKYLLCSKLKTTKTKFEKKCETDEPALLRFRENVWSLPKNFEGFSEEEVERTNQLVNEIEEYNILSSPRLPVFKTPNNKTPHEYLTDLCRDGWKKKLVSGVKVQSKENETIYLERIKRELGVIKEAELSSYFLIVQDYINFANNKGWLVGCGRGSAAGCLVSYLIGITKIDPIEYNLIFERFYSSARKGSMPDIDTDFPSEHREEVIEYIRNKYGRDKVCHMITFAEIKGATAIKEVLRINEACPFEQMNEITKQIPEIGKVTDEMENTGEDSLLLFTLKYRPDKLKDWARYEEGKITGDFAQYFQDAIRLEGTISGTGKHASALVIYEEPLDTVCPMLVDKSSDEPLAGFSMDSAEKVGIVKMDCLSISSLSKLMEINNILKERSSYYKALKV